MLKCALHKRRKAAKRRARTNREIDAMRQRRKPRGRPAVVSVGWGLGFTAHRTRQRCGGRLPGRGSIIKRYGRDVYAHARQEAGILPRLRAYFNDTPIERR